MINLDKAVATARVLLGKSNVNTQGPTDLSIVIEMLGLTAQYKENMSDKAALNRENKTIYVKKDNEGIHDKIFAIACEIGHYVLHSQDDNIYRENEAKQEATSFAVELLMPYYEVRSLVLKGYNEEYLMRYFNVNYELAKSRYDYMIDRLY